MADPNINLASPHLDSGVSLEKSMREVFMALIPVTITAIYFYGVQALFLILVSILSAVITEIIARKMKGERPTLQDGTAFLIGLLIGLLMSPLASIWRAVFTSLIGVGIGKELSGGLGWNRFNPALFGYVATLFLARWFPFLASSEIRMASIDAVSQGTPLTLMHLQRDLPSLAELFIAFPGGALSETSALAVILGGAFLIYREHINWRIPVSIIVTSLVLSIPFNVNPIYYVLSGGLLFGAFFMATDWVTSPVNNRGMWLFGTGIGLLVVVFRLVLPPTGGVALAILIMNAFVPLIERLTKHPSLAEPKFDKYPG